MLNKIGGSELIILSLIILLLVLWFGMKPLGRAAGRFMHAFRRGHNETAPKE